MDRWRHVKLGVYLLAAFACVAAFWLGHQAINLVVACILGLDTCVP